MYPNRNNNSKKSYNFIVVYHGIFLTKQYHMTLPKDIGIFSLLLLAERFNNVGVAEESFPFENKNVICPSVSYFN